MFESLPEDYCDSAGLVQARQRKESVQKIPPAIAKPIAGLPSMHEEAAGRFLGKTQHALPTVTTSAQSSSSRFVEDLLPGQQNSPVHRSGELNQIIQNVYRYVQVFKYCDK